MHYTNNEELLRLDSITVRFLVLLRGNSKLSMRFLALHVPHGPGSTAISPDDVLRALDFGGALIVGHIGSLASGVELRDAIARLQPR